MLLILTTIITISIFISVFIIYRISGNSLVFSPTVLYLLFYFFFHYPLIFIIDRSELMYVLVINLGMIGFAFGSYIAMHGASPVNLRSRQIKLPLKTSSNKYLIVMLMLGILFSILMYRGLPPTFDILIKAAQGKNVYSDLLQMSAFRAELTKSHYFGGDYRGQGAIKLFNEVIWQLIVVFSFVRANQLRTQSSWIQFCLVFILALLIIAGAGAKSPVVFLVLVIIVSISFMKNLSFRKIFRYGLFFIIALILIQMAQVSRFASSTGPVYLNAAEALFNRIIAGNGLYTYHIIDLIETGQVSFRYGWDHLTAFINSIPGVQFDVPFAHEIYLLTGGNYNKTTYASYTYIGSIYLDFGLFGAFFISMIVGILFQFIFRYMQSIRQNTLSMAFCSVWCLHLGEVSFGSIGSLPATLFVIGNLYLAIKFFAQILNGFRPLDALKT